MDSVSKTNVNRTCNGVVALNVNLRSKDALSSNVGRASRRSLARRPISRSFFRFTLWDDLHHFFSRSQSRCIHASESQSGKRESCGRLAQVYRKSFTRSGPTRGGSAPDLSLSADVNFCVIHADCETISILDANIDSDKPAENPMMKNINEEHGKDFPDAPPSFANLLHLIAMFAAKRWYRSQVEQQVRLQNTQPSEKPACSTNPVSTDATVARKQLSRQLRKKRNTQ